MHENGRFGIMAHGDRVYVVSVPVNQLHPFAPSRLGPERHVFKK